MKNGGMRDVRGGLCREWLGGVSGWLVLSVLLALRPVAAAEEDYASSVPVDDQSPAEFERGVQLGMEQVLEFMRLSDQQVRNPERTIEKAADYLLRFGYSGTPSGVGYVLELQFDEQALRALRVNQRARRPVVTPAKPAKPARPSSQANVLFWLAIEDPTAPYVVGSESHPDVATALMEQAKTHGVSLALPQMDNSEQRMMDYYTLRAEQAGQVWQASQPYRPKHIVYGTLQQFQGRWLTRFSRLDQSGSVVEAWENQGDSGSKVLGDAMKALSVQLKPKLVKPRRVVASGSGRKGYVVAVNNVRDFAQFKAVERLVARYAPRAQVAALSTDRVEFDLGLNGLNALKSGLSNESQLRLLPNPNAAAGFEVDYRP